MIYVKQSDVSHGSAFSTRSFNVRIRSFFQKRSMVHPAWWIENRKDKKGNISPNVITNTQDNTGEDTVTAQPLPTFMAKRKRKR